MNIAACLLGRARNVPDAPALSFGTRTLSFGAFAERIRCLAGGLRARLALAPGDRILIWMENRPEFLETLFASWVAGLVAVPVNAKLHAREAAYIARDCDAAAIVTGEALVEGLMAALAEAADDQARPAPPAVVVAASAEYERLAGSAPIDCAETQPTDPAWIFYTSGTTGRPKGAMLTHRNLLAMSLIYYADIERVAPGHTKLHAAPLSHATGIYSLPHLFGGGHQVVLPAFEPDAVLDALERHRDVTLFAAPTMVTRLVQSAGASVRVPGLRTLYYGGGPMYVADLQRALDCFGPRLWQLYGQGESPMTLTGLSKRDHQGDGGAEHLARLASCGVARTGVEVRVVDGEGRESRIGEAGEVIARGDTVMAGYWRNPQATAATLRDGWLWTGDVGALDARGYLTLHDRSKDLIISGGSNIYPREIEEVLLRHPAVLECSVVGRPHPDWGEEVVAFLVPRPQATIAEEELDALCLAHIARFKRPREYRVLPALPKNNYGKILKTELRRRLAGYTLASRS